MAIRQFNARPRPRCLAVGFYGPQLARLEATLPGIRSINSIGDVHQAEWDLLICNGGDVRDVSPNLFVIAFGGLLLDKAHGVDDSAVIVRQDAFEEEGERRRPVSVAVEFSTPDVVPARFEALSAGLTDWLGPTEGSIPNAATSSSRTPPRGSRGAGPSPGRERPPATRE